MLYILAVIYLADYGTMTPDRYEALHAYDTLAECWAEAAVQAQIHEGQEAIIVCLPEQPDA